LKPGRPGNLDDMTKSRTAPAAAAAATALAGAAAVGGKLAHDHHARTAAEREADRAYRLRADEHVADGIRRIARGRLANAHEQLDGASRRGLGEAVHETRKELKRLRAGLRLSRDALGEETYDRENTAYRMAGKRLSDARDAQVLIETLDDLAARSGDELAPGLADDLRDRLRAEHEQAQTALREDDTLVARTLGELAGARTRTAAWTLSDDGFAALAPGLKRIYRRGRRGLRAAAKDPTDENLHEARKRAKDLWHATQLLRPAAPKKLKRLSRRAHRLANLLGDDHDLAVLRDHVRAHPQCFADEAAQQALLAVLERRRAALQRRAVELGREVYAQRPKRFAAGVQRGWRKRAARRPAPLAG
jgi:CHAD domain-containing protein